MSRDPQMPPTVKCPSCGKRLEWSEASPWRPFCSERCRLIDLGAWLDGSRAIPGEPVPSGSGEDDAES